MEPTQETNNAPSNAFLSFMAFVFRGLSMLTIGQLYDCLFGMLSLASLVMILIINYPKAKEVIKTYRNKL